MSTNEKRKELIKLVNMIDAKSIDFLHGIFNLADKGCNKRALLSFFSPDMDGNKIDTAYPIDYFRKIEEMYPDANNGSYIFDYNKNLFGELININNIVAKRFLTFLWELKYVNY